MTDWQRLDDKDQTDALRVFLACRPGPTVSGSARWGRPGRAAGIYEQFSATSHLAPCAGVLCGAFDSIAVAVDLSSTLHGFARYNFPGAVATIHLPTGAHPVLLATGDGPIGGVATFADIIAGNPGADVGGHDATRTEGPAISAGFRIPPSR